MRLEGKNDIIFTYLHIKSMYYIVVMQTFMCDVCVCSREC